MKPTPEQLRNRFLHHPPKDQAQIDLHAEVSRRALEFAVWLTEVCQDGRQLSLLLTDLESVRMRANASIAGAE